jgi:YggT family protein
MQNSLIFLVKTISDLYLLTFLLRFVLQWVRADFYNPISQFVLKATNPLVLPVRRVLPNAGSIDVPTLVVLFGLECAATWLLLGLAGAPVSLVALLQLVLLRLVALTLWFYSIAILVYVILSWVAQAQYSPVAALLADVVNPLLRPVRRLIPPLGGLDLTPLLIIILIQAVAIALPLPNFLR